MISIQITDIKNFMKNLLYTDSFDKFQLMYGSVTTANTYEIDGKVNKEFFGEDYETSELFGHDYAPWNMHKEFIKNIIKGKHTPLSFKFILYANDELKGVVLTDVPAETVVNVSNLVLNIRFDEYGLTLTSGISTISFIMDKSAEEAWDKYLTRFLSL